MKPYTSIESSTLDQQVKSTAARIKDNYSDQYGFSWGHNQQGKFKKNIIWEDIPVGFMPDGGVFLNEDNLVKVAFEAKYQQNAGNAYERHAKNLTIAEYKAAPDGMRYITFMSGKGAAEGAVMWKYAVTMMVTKNYGKALNVVHPTGCSFFLKEDGFTDAEIENIFNEALK